jgi:NAD(P)-dependent dehydrogenase (short-subunit alcohol dehydrogenase family)
MRERQTGCIANISSAAGLFATPTQIPYSASKWAVECMGEALAHELKPFGVRVVNIEPGVVATKIFENSAARSHFDKSSPYATTMRRIGRIFAAGLKKPTTPETVAEKILEAISAEAYRFRWPVGADAQHFFEARATTAAEEWIELAEQTDEDEYNEGFRELFGLKI